LCSVYFFGWRSFALVMVSCAAAYVAEVIFETARRGSPTESVFVSGALLGLSLPPYTPFWIAAAGAVFGIVFGKQVFGGFGTNVFNPAIVGRCFLYVTFPLSMTSEWMTPGSWPWGRVYEYAPLDAMTAATPLISFKQAGLVPDMYRLLVGSVAGSIGETSAIAVLLGGAYILVKRVADWRYPLSCILGALVVNTALWGGGAPGVLDPLRNLAAGSFLFAAFFMVTEPVSGCVKRPAKWAYGFLIGALWIIIRSFSGFPEATAFAILLGNTFGPLMDQIVTARSAKAKQAA
jgi:Na+-transporting NADH:ubiquinone oxidoreductase subunit B